MTVSLAFQSVFLGALLCGAISDIRDRRVPNILVVAMLGWALVGAVFELSPAASVLATAAGAGAGLALWLPFWLFGMLGAGDVKFFAAGAAFLGPSLGWRTALLAALLGGVWSVVVLVRRSGVYHTMSLVATQALHPGSFVHGADVTQVQAEARSLPYAVPMALALAGAATAPTAVFALLGIAP